MQASIICYATSIKKKKKVVSIRKFEATSPQINNFYQNNAHFRNDSQIPLK